MARYNVSLDSHPEPGEGGEAARCDLGEVEHQGGHPVPGEVGVTPLSLDRLRDIVVIFVHKQGILTSVTRCHYSLMSRV